MESFGKFIAVLLLALTGVSVNVWAAMCMFSWVITPQYGITGPSFAQLFVFFLLLSAIRAKYDKDMEDSDWNDVVKYSIFSIVASIIFIGLAALVASIAL